MMMRENYIQFKRRRKKKREKKLTKSPIHIFSEFLFFAPHDHGFSVDFQCVAAWAIKNKNKKSLVLHSARFHTCTHGLDKSKKSKKPK